MTIQPGTDIGRYHILEQLGEGGMAVVYKAYDTHLDCEVAIKVVRMDNLPSNRLEKTLLRFQSEAKRMARLNHANIVKVVDYGDYQGTPYLVMPYIPGGTLKERMGKPMAWEEAVKLITPIAEALGYAHSKGVIHRDVKPSNVLLTESGTVMLSDFGIAKILDDEDTREFTTTGVGIGTPEYMSPEQALGGEVDARSDIYALGILLYELVTGRKPFEATTPMAVLIKQARDPLPRVSQFIPGFPEKAEQVLIKALAKEQINRYQSMKDFLAAIMLIKKPISENAAENIFETLISNQGESRSEINKKANMHLSRVFGIIFGVLLVISTAILFPKFTSKERAFAVKDLPQEMAPNMDQENDLSLEKQINPQIVIYEGKIDIALLAPLTGPVPTFGESTEKGALMAVDDWNAKGGILGKRINLIIEDSQCTAGPAVVAANKVIDQDQVNYILGEICSSASIPISQMSEENGVLQISPTSTNPNVTLNSDGSTKQFIFRACFIDPFQGWAMARFAMNEGYETAYVVYDPGNEYTEALADAFMEHYESFGGKIIGIDTYAGTDTDFYSILVNVANSGAKILYFPDYFNIINLVARQAKEMGLEAIILGGDGWDSSDLDFVAADGYYFTNHYNSQDISIQEWVARYQIKYAETPDALAGLAYEAADVLFSAIEIAGVDDPAAVSDVLESNTFSTLTGNIVFDEFHNPIKSVVILKIENGKVIYYGTISP